MNETAIAGVRPEQLRAEYDFIVVGAGAAGCVMAHRLSQDVRASVLLVEGGGTDIGQTKISDPRLWTGNFGTDTDWGCRSVPQAHLNGRAIVTPVGKIIGGGSSINATVWLNGDKADYDAWEAAAGPLWGFEHIVRNFKKTERFAGGESAMRGGSGMIATRASDASHPVTRAFIDSAVGCGKTEQRDVNAIAEVGEAAGQKDINTDAQMRRVSAAHGYLVPALGRTNLALLTGAPVLRLDIEHGECRGVFVQVNGETRRIAAAKEVILSAGGLLSPKLLMLSGVGPADHLRSFGIPVAMDSPRIGQNLHDHLLVRIVFSANGPTPPQTDTGHAGITWHKSEAARAGPDIQLFGRMHPQNVPEPEPKLCHHGRADEAEEPGHSAARLGRSVSGPGGRSELLFRSGRRPCLRGRDGAWHRHRQRTGLRSDAQGADQHSGRRPRADRRAHSGECRDLLSLRRDLRDGPRSERACR